MGPKAAVSVLDTFYKCSNVDRVARKRSSLQLSDAEWKVMHAVWSRTPATARDVLDELEGETGWAYTTVKTMMTRLVEKRALKTRMRGNTSVYEPALTRDRAQRSALRALVDKAFGGALGPMVHFLVADEKLSKKERREILRRLEEQGS